MLGIDMVEMQISLFIAGHFHVAPELDVHGMLGLAHFKRIADAHPHIRNLNLVSFGVNELTEQTALITDAVAVDRQVFRCGTVHKACRKTAETAVSESGIALHCGDIVVIDIKILQAFDNDVIDAEVLEVAGKRTSEQKLHGEVVYLLGILLPCCDFSILPVDRGIVAHHLAEYEVPFCRMGFLNGRTAHLYELLRKFLFEL